MYIVHTEASLGWGGQEIRILTEAQGMMARGHRVEIWAVPGSNILEQAPRRAIPAQALPIGRKNLSGISIMRRALIAARPDVVNTHSSTDAWLVALASLTLRAPPPMVRTRHISSSVPDNFPTRWLYQRATRHIVTTGTLLLEKLVHENRFPREHMTSVPTGVDTGQFSPADKHQVRRELGLDPDKRYIGIVATLRSWKGHLYLLDAFARLAADDASLRLVIVGDGPFGPNIEKKIEEHGLNAKVHLAGRQDNVPLWLQALDVFCLSSYANEGVPQSVVQAMLTGLPVVTTTVGSITEAVTDGVTGVLVAPRDAAALAAGLRRVLDDAGLALRLGLLARTMANARFSLDTMLDGMEQVFNRVVGRERGK